MSSPHDKTDYPPPTRNRRHSDRPGPDAGRTATIIQEPLPGSTTHTIQFSDGRAVVLPAAHTAPEQDG